MARLKPPGTRSNIALVFSSAITILSLLILIGGHLLIALEIYFQIHQGGSLHAIATYLMIPEWSLWLTIALALLMDGWIFYSERASRKKADKR